jgi:thimet oligopeptidase
VYEKEVLDMFARHYKTGAFIPDSLVQKVKAAENLNSGLDTRHQLFYAGLDMYLHDKYQPFSPARIETPGQRTEEVRLKVRDKYAMFKNPARTPFQANFGHLMGYAAGYYGYQWSKVYAQDMWSVFKEQGPLNSEIGKKYRNKVLKPGGSRKPYQMVTDFLGREPNNRALLRDLGVPPESL